jgi:putative nucleotidyltransferase with HDIG domain
VAAAALGASALTQLNADLLINAGIGFINGAVCAVVAMGALPFLETTFRVTTNTWLLELASPEQELLKELSVKAPGTYSHSVMVANLAEVAARAVGSDPLQARVAAYYHDVGKMKRPQFFVENQPEGVNPHEGLSPNLSALIITSHVRDGVEMLEAEHIPPDLVEIVKEHHGTSMVRYFYEKAMDQDGSADVEENRFRYHFPKPHRRTAGILMLADSVEATARTLNRPSAATIEQMVSRIVDGKMVDGQLDDCDLTYSDLTRIKAAFSRILIGAYHPRVDYPQAPAAGGEKHGPRKAGGSAAGQPA